MKKLRDCNCFGSTVGSWGSRLLQPLLKLEPPNPIFRLIIISIRALSGSLSKKPPKFRGGATSTELTTSATWSPEAHVLIGF